MRVAVIVNPVSGRSGRHPDAGRQRASIARAWLAQNAVDADVVSSESRAHAIDLSAGYVARGFDRIVAWGGDGTANDVAGPLIGTRVVFGVVRSGSGDGLARGLGLSRDPHRALADAVGAATRVIDVGWFGPRHFLNVAGVGFDAAVADAFNSQRGQRASGIRGYVRAGVSGVWGYRPTRYRLELDGVTTDCERLLVAFANGREYGNGFYVAPDADPSDGWLDSLVVDAGSPFRQLWRARRLFVAPGAPAEGVARRRIRSARISAERMMCHVDGESFETEGSIDVRLAPQAIRIAAPAGRQRSVF